MANAHATKNEIAKVCNSSSDWLKQTQKKLDTCTDAINSAKQHVNGLNELNEQVSWIFLFQCDTATQRIEIQKKNNNLALNLK